MRRTSKGKVRWSKLYSFSCLRPTGAEGASQDAAADRLLLDGAAGFSRMVFCNQSRLHGKESGCGYRYPSNRISTTKYNFITFLPKALFEQFRRVANLYFLLAALLSLSPLTPFSPESLIAPLVFVVGLSMTKEAVEDWRRFVQWAPPFHGPSIQIRRISGLLGDLTSSI
ncbi:hypothetical protein ACLOJK_020007 [Asimina triloba]